MQAFIGIDVSKATLDLALYLGNEYKASFRIDYSIKEIEKVISDFIEITGEKNFIFGCEATGVYHLRLANYLFGLGYKIKILNPRISYFYHCAENITSSTDKVSAKVIARQLINDKGPFWEPEEEEINRMRGLLLRRNQILAAINREKCRLDRFQDDFYPRESIIKHLEYLKKDKEKVEKELRRIIQKSHKLKKNIELLTSIDCVGFLTASVFLAKIGNVNRFSNANKVVKFLGLCPENKRSGTSVNSSRLSKKGDKLYRKILYCAMVSGIHKDNFLGKYYDKLYAKGKSHKTCITALMKKVTRVMYAVVRDQRAFSKTVYGNPNIA